MIPPAHTASLREGGSIRPTILVHSLLDISIGSLVIDAELFLSKLSAESCDFSLLARDNRMGLEELALDPSFTAVTVDPTAAVAPI